MNKTLEITFGKIDLPAKGTVISFAKEGPEYPENTKGLNDFVGGAIETAASASDFKGKNKSFIDLLAPGNTTIARLLICGLGSNEDHTSSNWMDIGGQIYAKLTHVDKNIILVFDPEVMPLEDNETVAELALGMLLRSYRFDKYKTQNQKNKQDRDKTGPNKIIIQCSEPTQVRKQFSTMKAVSEGIFVARDCVNEPANVLTPSEFVKKAQALEKIGVEVEILDQKALAKNKMNALLAVGQGSQNASYVAVMNWKGSKKKSAPPVAFVGKGVTFDTGGISLKPAAGMEDMKGDMAGAGCVTGLMHALAKRKAKVNAIGVIGLVENMPGPNAQRPGDIVTSMSGQTIEVLNTDAEGRLVLADAMWYCQEKYQPKFMIDLATLTGAILVALGQEYSGIFSNDDELVEQLMDSGNKTGEKVWRMPIGPKYDKMINSKIADMKNIGGRYAGSITAAQFLQRFVKKDVPWVHIDIAGTGMNSPKTDINTSWGSGYGVRLLNQLVADYYED